MRWVINNKFRPTGVRSVSFAMVQPTSAITVYETAAWQLRVRSTPFVNVRPSPAWRTAGRTIPAGVPRAHLFSITAPRLVRYGIRTWCSKWVLNGVDQPGRVITFRIRMRTANTLTAEVGDVRSLCITEPFSIWEK